MKKYADRNSAVSVYEALVASLTNLSDADPMVLGGKKMAKADVLVVLNAFLTAAKLLESLRQQAKVALADESSKLVTAKPLRALLKSYLESRFGKSSPDLLDFGFTPAKVPVKTAASKAAAAEKAAKTRKADQPGSSKSDSNGQPNGSPATAPAVVPAKA